MLSFTIIIAAASIGLGLSTLLRLPAVPLLLVAGVGLGAVTAQASIDELQQALILGLTFLVFVSGTELNPRRIGNQKRAVLVVSFFQFFLIAGLGYGISWYVGLSAIASMYVALAVAASSTLVVVRILQRRRLAFEPFGRVVLGVLLIQDLLVVLCISVLAKVEDGWVGVLTGGMAAIALLALTWIFQKHIAPYLLVTLRLDEETLLLTVLAVLFLFCGAAFFIELPIVVGAFFAGVSLSTFPVNGVIRAQLSSLSDFFLAVFFVALGATLSLPDASGIMLASLLAILVLLVTPILVMVIGELVGLSSRAALESGLLLAQTSEFSLIVALIGVQQGHIDSQLLSVIALITVITMILTPFITLDGVSHRLLKIRSASLSFNKQHGLENHIVLIGGGQSGREILERLRVRGENVIVIDSDIATTRRLRQEDVVAVRGDGSDPRALEAAKARNAKLIISTMRRVADNEKLLRYVGEVPVLVGVFEQEEATAITKSGGVPILYSKNAANEFMNWFGERFITPSV